MSGIAVTMVMVLVIRQYAAGGWNGASETESALDDARDAYMHACTWAQSKQHHHWHTLCLMSVGVSATLPAWVIACKAEPSHSTAAQGHPAALVLMVRLQVSQICVCKCSLSCMGCCQWRRGSF